LSEIDEEKILSKISEGKGKQRMNKICGGCGKTIETDDIWYPFFDICTCGGGIQYLHAQCAIERVFSVSKEDVMERLKAAEEEKTDPLSDGLMNLYWMFPISPLHWVKFYAIGDDEKEIRKIVESHEKKKKSKK
jgi:hypothetical protein